MKDRTARDVARSHAQPGRFAADQQRQILLICDFTPSAAGTILDHVHSFVEYSDNKIFLLNNLGSLPKKLLLNKFDGIIIHYSIVISINHFLSPSARDQIRKFNGFKAVFIQDDYRWIDRTVDALSYLCVNALFCLARPDVIDQVYSRERLPGVHRETVLAGYVADKLTQRPVRSFRERPIEVGYRGRVLPAWIGAHGQEKRIIAERFIADAAKWRLRVDIAYREEDRIYGDAWIVFIAGCKAVLGCEGGASVCDFTGEIQEKVEAYAREHLGATFEEIRDLFFKGIDGKIMMNVGTPRCFEAAALRTLMILYEGEYSGIVTPWRHYVPLKKDHSNMAEVVSVLRDPERAEEIIERAYREVALNPAYTFRAMVTRVDEVIDSMFEYTMARTECAYSDSEFFRAKRNSQSIWRQVRRRILESAYWLVMRSMRRFLTPSQQERSIHWVRTTVQRFRAARNNAAQHGLLGGYVLLPIYCVVRAFIRLFVPRRHQDAARLAIRTGGLRVLIRIGYTPGARE